MKKNVSKILLVFFLLSFSIFSQDYLLKTAKDKKGNEYQYVTNDPYETRIYTLENGLKVYLSQNKAEPRIQTYIAVKAGSKNDPDDATGLAHYFEHMMFKGTSKVGTLDWEKEKPLLDKIEELFEKHRKEKDPVKKKAIYEEIDKVSQEASKYVANNEYDKLIGLIGGNGTNAFTSNDFTMYVNNIPSNELDRWLEIEDDRFTDIQMRLFHTELETVYEEFNISQDNEYNQVFQAIFKSQLKKHPYGYKTTLGSAEDLKSPSIKRIKEFYNTYYVANNMALCLSGDLDFESTIESVKKSFGDWKQNPKLPKFSFEKEKNINSIDKVEVLGPNAPFVLLGFRTKGIDSEEADYLGIVSSLLTNGKAGLMDLNLNQKQKVIYAGTFPYQLKDYGFLMAYAYPGPGQSLDQAKDLVLQEIENIKKGNFDEWLIEAIINDIKIQNISKLESNERAYEFADAFVNDIPYLDQVKGIEKLYNIKKADIVKWANETFKDNYTVVYKNTGVNKNIIYAEKPQITPIEINRADNSSFFKEFSNRKETRIEPKFVNYSKNIVEDKYGKLPLSYIQNKENERFNLTYILDMGKSSDKKLALAVEYLPYLGTSKHSAEELQKLYYRYGINLSVNVSLEKSYITISGLNSSLEKASELLEELLTSVVPDDNAYYMLVNNILKVREDAKLDKNAIFNSMIAKGIYKDSSPNKDILSTEELVNIKTNELTDKIKELLSYEHRIFYYGPSSLDDVKKVLTKTHPLNKEYKKALPKTIYEENDFAKEKVYFVDYDMVQSNFILISKDRKFDEKVFPYSRMFNEYYGLGLSSVVFQEIREAKGLAYTAYAFYSPAASTNKNNYIYSYVGTQPDKLFAAIDGVKNLMNDMPKSESQFNGAKTAVLKNTETERILRESIFWNKEYYEELGIKENPEEKIYNSIKTMDINAMDKFFKENIKGKKYDLIVIGKKENIDMEKLSKYGELKELSLEEIFGY